MRGGVPYHGEVDAFGVYCPEDGAVYMVPICDLGGITSIVSLRLAPTKSGQRAGVRFANAFRLGQYERPPRKREACA